MNSRFTYGTGALLVSALTFFAFTGTGAASEQLPAGDYNLVVPGVGGIAFSLDATGVVTVGTLPEGFTLVTDEDEQGELEAILSNGDITVELEIEDGKVALSIDDGLVPGTYAVTLADGSTLTVEVAADGTVTVTDLPDGYQLVDQGDDILISAPDGTMYELELDADEIQLKVAEDEDDESEDDDSENESDEDDDSENESDEDDDSENESNEDD